MNKIRILLLSIIIFYTLTGCNQTSNTTNMSTKTLQSIIATFENKADLDNMDRVHIKKIDNKHYLLGYNEADDYTNLWYNIINIDNYKTIKVKGTIDYISHVLVDEGNLYFICDGGNIITCMKEFPKKYKVNLENGQLLPEPIYDSMRSYEYRIIGNNTNETLLSDISSTNNSITYHFDKTDNTIIAGGYQCPDIITVSKEENCLVADIEGLIADEEKIKSLESLDFIESINISQYSDSINHKHLVQTINLNNITKYTCELVKRKDEGKEGLYLDLVIKFK